MAFLPGAKSSHGQLRKLLIVSCTFRIYTSLLISLQDKKGWQVSIGLAVLVIIMTVILHFLDVRYMK